MTNFMKTYIGKGKQISNYDIVKVTLTAAEVLKHKYTKDGVEYITFEVAKMKEADKYGRTHTAYVTTPEYKVEKAIVEEPVAQPKAIETQAQYPNSSFTTRRKTVLKAK